MSEPVMERSVLERKERDELQTIARAMGAQPTARTRKADLVDMILAAAGVTTGDGGSGKGSDADQVSPTGNGSAGKSAKRATSSKASTGDEPKGRSTSKSSKAKAGADDAHPDGGNGTGAGDDGDTADADEVQAPADEGDEPESRDRSGSGSGARKAGDDGRDGEGEGRAPGGSTDDRGNARNGDADGDQRERQDQGRQGGDDSEAGNRRRRRRGRDRDRNEQRPDDQWQGEPVEVSGLLDLRDEGYGFLRTNGYLPSKDDVYVSVKQVRQVGLRKGDHVAGASRPANRNEKNPALLRIDAVNGDDPEKARSRPRFEDLTPLFPDEKLRLETPTLADMTARIVDLIAPIGKGQRGLIVSPPKAGKTSVVKQIVRSIETNNPEVHLMVLLVDERPEEVTDMRRHTKGEVLASTFDRPAEEHTQLSELAIERAKRLVEQGEDVVVILDGITRLARAYNLAAPATGRIMSGGVDSGALYPPKKFFGAARNIEEGGSLTIIATALIETGSKMDEVIFEEFKGTGNMELRLDRRLAERRIYPAIDVDASSTRHEELLFDNKQLKQVWQIRRALHALSSEGAGPGAALERLLDGMKQFKSNEEFLAEAAKAGPAAGS